MNHNLAFQLQRWAEDANFLSTWGTGRSRALCEVHEESSSGSRSGAMAAPRFCCQDENNEDEMWIHHLMQSHEMMGLLTDPALGLITTSIYTFYRRVAPWRHTVVQCSALQLLFLCGDCQVLRASLSALFRYSDFHLQSKHMHTNLQWLRGLWSSVELCGALPSPSRLQSLAAANSECRCEEVERNINLIYICRRDLVGLIVIDLRQYVWRVELCLFEWKYSFFVVGRYFVLCVIWGKLMRLQVNFFNLKMGLTKKDAFSLQKLIKKKTKKQVNCLQVK